MSEVKERAKQVTRSVAYPSIPLNEAIDSTKKLKDALGKGPYSREEAARALGHSQLTGPASRKIAALVQYGLLERNGNTYNQSDLSQDILQPLSGDSENVAIKNAAVRPKLFQKVYGRFGGQALPSMLQNILIRDGVNEKAAGDVVRIFTETMKFAGLLVNGVLTNQPLDGDGEGLHDEQIAPTALNTSQTPIQKTIVSTPVEGANDFVFEFSGGIRLLIPRTTKTSEAIADGELKEVRNALAAFATKNMQDELPEDDD